LRLSNFGIELVYKRILKEQDELIEKEGREMSKVQEEIKETEI
jgi:hypothetical protein